MPDNRFTKAHRIRKSNDFDSVFRKGFKLVTPTLIFRVLLNDKAGCRIGLAIPKKVGNAVKRNLVKRRIREAFRHTNHKFISGLDIVISPRRGIQEKHFREYLRSFEILAKKTHTIRDRGDHE